MAETLVSQLQRALFEHQARIELASSVQMQHYVLPRCPGNPPVLEYISSMLMDDDSDEESSIADQSPGYQEYMDELAAVISQGGESGLEHSDSTARSHSEEEQVSDRLHSLLMHCARAVVASDSARVYQLIAEIRCLASPGGGSYERTALFFANALVARLQGYGPKLCASLNAEVTRRRYLSIRRLNLPCFSVTERFANLTILNACKGAKRVHIIDYGILYGCQWPWLIKALSERPEGPPRLKITGIELPSMGNLIEVEKRLVEYADKYGVSLEFQPMISSSWETAQPYCNTFTEFVVINCNLRLRHLREDGTVADSPRKLFFEKIHRLRPALFVQSVISANKSMNSPFFLQRFEEALRHFSKRMEYYDIVMKELNDEVRYMEKVTERNIINVVACEGLDRTERACSYTYWDSTARRAGFEQLPVDDSTVEALKSIWKGEGFNLATDENWLLCERTQVPIFGLSSWKPKTVIP